MMMIKEFLLVYMSVIFQTQWHLSYMDLLILFSIYLVLRFGWIEGAAFSVLGGIFWDSLSGAPLGLKSFSLVVASAVVGFVHSIFYQEHMTTRFAMVLIGTLVSLTFEGIFYAVSGQINPMFVSKIFQSALGTSVLAVFIHPVLNRFFRDRYSVNWA